MRAQRDMSAKEFADALTRHGMRQAGFMGYTNINVPGHHIEVSYYNAGMRRRSQLAYLLWERDKAMRECRHCQRMRADHGKLIKNEKGKTDWIPACPDNSGRNFEA